MDGGSNKERQRELLHSEVWGRKLGQLSACDKEKAGRHLPFLQPSGDRGKTAAPKAVCAGTVFSGDIGFSLQADMEGMGHIFLTQCRGPPGSVALGRGMYVAAWGHKVPAFAMGENRDDLVNIGILKCYD